MDNPNINLLVNLRKYRRRDSRDSLEDFIIEAFAWLLNNEEGYVEYFLNYDKFPFLKLNTEIDFDNEKFET
jgi:hypothetical protein